MPREQCATRALKRALACSAERAGAAIAFLDEHGFKRWSSHTFAGGRHTVTLSGRSSTVLEAWLGGLPDADLRFPRHLVADLQVSAIARGPELTEAHLEVLTVEEAMGE